MKIDHVLIIGFGGPRNPDEVMPFLYNVTRGKRIPERRLAEVAAHYDAAGGNSPYNTEVENLALNISNSLKIKGLEIPVFYGMRIWQPFLLDVMLHIKEQGLKKGVAVILSPHRSEASYDRYIASLDQARRINSATEIRYRFLNSWYDHELFIRSHVETLGAARKKMETAPEKIFYLFSAHSIPSMAAGDSGYEREVQRSAALIAKEAGLKNWSVCYQSRSGNPAENWLEPDVRDVLPRVKAEGFKGVCMIPVGFVLDNVEILYDLDTEAKGIARKLGLSYDRADTVARSEPFLTMFADLIMEAVKKDEVSLYDESR